MFRAGLSWLERRSSGNGFKRMTPLTLLKLGVLLVLFIAERSSARGKPHQIKPGCRYEGRRYQEGMPVSTSEPCLQCRCIEGALRCRLRVCPRLPTPPPPGCWIRSPGENVCCAELMCGDSRDNENMLRRASLLGTAEEEIQSIEEAQSSRLEGCVHEGVRYGPGSAMMGSRRCEYCYCISGARRCIRPKCLVPLPGCTPLYAPHSCCPVAYNCTYHLSSTLAPLSGNGCRVGDRTYEEGEMVREIEWKAACDNCFCAMGAVRCVPLACAPPLQGCSPIVREGHCCPSTYNCSGSIEVKATQNYASYAFISKDYAKFRKETNFFPTLEQTTNLSVEGRGHRVVEDGVESGTTDLEEESSIPSDSTLPSTLDTDPMDNEIVVETLDYTKSTLEIATTTPILVDELTANANTESTTLDSTLSTKEKEVDEKDVGEEVVAEDYTADPSAVFSTSTLAESTITVTEEDSSSSTNITGARPSLEFTTMPSELIANNGYDGILGLERQDEEAEAVDIIERNKITTYPSVTTFKEELAEDNGNFTFDNETMDIAQTTEVTDKESVSKSPAVIPMGDNILVMNVTVKTNVSVGNIQGVTINPMRTIPPDVEAILNITQRQKGEDYDYDYSEPTLPPSLPNVRIIPFVAADALVKDKTVSSAVTGYPSGSVVVPPELRPTDTSGFYEMATQENRFSPPVETEGGFVPREPPYFDPPYHSTDLNLEIGTGVTVVPAPITNPHRKNEASSCLYENVEYRHGDILPSTTICVICMCYYGEVVCSTEKCPPLKIGCRRINTEEHCCGKVVCVDAEESPTVVLDRADATAPSLHQPIVSPDPFRDVIKTEPAPDLPSLIEDMIPYLVEHGITTPQASTPTSTSKGMIQGPPNHQQHPSNFNFIEKLPLVPPPYGEKQPESVITTKKYRPNQETKEKLNLTHEKADINNIAERISDSISESYDRVSLAKMNHTTASYEEQSFAPVNLTNLLEGGHNISSENETSIAIDLENVTVEYGNASRSSTTDKTFEDVEEPIFSLDSVLDLLFSSDASSTEESTPSPESVSMPEKTSKPQEEHSSTVRSTVKPSTEAGVAIETSSKVLDNEIRVSVASLLKLAGCNIYGRMYRVGRIITELSGPCLECRCTEIGVQCKQLEC